MKNSEIARIEKINHELAAVRKEFNVLVKEVSEEIWEERMTGDIWTIKEELVHIIQALQVLPKGIKQAIDSCMKMPTSNCS